MTKLVLEHVHVEFHKPADRGISLKEFMVQAMFLRSRARKMVSALEDVSLEFKEGDRIGVIGHNGAGKSTLLRVLAGVYPPTKGRHIAEGKISSLFDIALGFEPESTGWENIAYRGYLQGETPRSIRAKRDEIAAFSDLGDFLNMPVRCYSSGMLVRLAFSIATSIEPEILLVDEAFSAGDLAFQTKAQNRTKELMSKARIMVLVSHDLGVLPGLCERVLWMDHGHVRQFGKPKEVIDAYRAAVTNQPTTGTANLVGARLEPSPTAAPLMKAAA